MYICIVTLLLLFIRNWIENVDEPDDTGYIW